MDNRLVPGMSYAEYDKAEGVRSHILKLCDISMKKAKLALDESIDESSDSLRLGQAAHVKILQPEAYSKFVLVHEKIDRRSNAGKQAWAELIEKGRGKILISEDEETELLAWANSVSEKKTASALLKEGFAELSIFWKDKASGVECRGRADYWSPKTNTLIDLKTTSKYALPGHFQWEIKRFDYHRQLAHYVSGLEHCGQEVKHVVLIVVEKDAPYGVTTLRISNDDLNLGRVQNRDALAKLSACFTTGQWPGYPDIIEDVGFPLNSYEAEVLLGL
jgi:hypothetical protein